MEDLYKLLENNMENIKVYQAINAVQTALAAEGIAKSKKNTQQGYAFRGIDEIYNTLSSELAKAHLCILPRMLNRILSKEQSKAGGVLFYVTVEAEFDFVSSEDGSKHTIKTFGEAMDSADKATNKAMSAAYKYACLQTFCIPTEGDNDTENTTPEVAAQPSRYQEAKKPKITEGYTCVVCNNPAQHAEGIAKTGKPYKMFRCSKNKEHAFFDRSMEYKQMMTNKHGEGLPTVQHDQWQAVQDLAAASQAEDDGLDQMNGIPF